MSFCHYCSLLHSRFCSRYHIIWGYALAFCLLIFFLSQKSGCLRFSFLNRSRVAVSKPHLVDGWKHCSLYLFCYIRLHWMRSAHAQQEDDITLMCPRRCGDLKVPVVVGEFYSLEMVALELALIRQPTLLWAQNRMNLRSFLSLREVDEYIGILRVQR